MLSPCRPHMSPLPAPPRAAPPRLPLFVRPMAAGRIGCLLFDEPWRSRPLSPPCTTLLPPSPKPPDPIRSPTNASCCLPLLMPCSKAALPPHCGLHIPAAQTSFHKFRARELTSSSACNWLTQPWLCRAGHNASRQKRGGVGKAVRQGQSEQRPPTQACVIAPAAAAAPAGITPAQRRPESGTCSLSHSLLGCSSPSPRLPRAQRLVPSLAVAGGWVPSGMASRPRRCTSPDTLLGADLRAEPACSAADCAPSCSASSAREGGS